MLVLPKSRVPVWQDAWQAQLEDHIISLAWSPDGQWVAAAAVSGPIKIFYAKDGALVCPLKGHCPGTSKVSWSADGRRFASAGQDGKIKFWDLINGRVLRSMDGGAAWVEVIAWNAGHGNAAVLASAAGRKIRLWNSEGVLLRDYRDHASTISAIEWVPASAQSKPLLVSAACGQLTFWDPQCDDPVSRLEWEGSLLAVAWSPNGNCVASGNQDATVHFWFIERSEELQMTGYATKVRELSWDFTSRYLATGGGQHITVWDCSGNGPDGSRPIVLQGHQAPLRCLAYQPGGIVLASGADDGMVAFWQPTKQNIPVAIQVFDDAVTQIAWSPNSRNLAAGSHGGLLKIIPMLGRER